MKQRDSFCPQRNFQPQPIQLEQRRPGFRHAEDLRHCSSPGHPFQVDIYAAIIANSRAAIHNKTVGLLRAAHDDFFVIPPLNEALGLVFGVVVIPAGRLPVLHGHNPHRRGQQFHPLRTNGTKHSVRADGIVSSDHMNCVLVVPTFRPHRQKRLRNFHGHSPLGKGSGKASVHPKIQRFGQRVFFIRRPKQCFVLRVIGNALLFGV